MDVYASAERLMGMDDDAWRRHANPWSGWTRIVLGAPLLTLALWSRAWLGLGPSLALTALVAGWIWLNPRAFPPPADYGAWMSRAVPGERIWLMRARLDVPAHHRRAANALTVAAALFAVPWLWGLAVLDPWLTLGGLAGSVGAKMWFCDRMVWLHADLTGTRPGEALPGPLLPAPHLPTPIHPDPTHFDPTHPDPTP
jgi:hypothetical protein